MDFQPHRVPVEPAQSAHLYEQFMNEIKGRRRIAQEALFNERICDNSPVVEYAYLQIRYICECFALACLAAQKAAVADNRAYWHNFYGDKLINNIIKINKRFYPTPIIATFSQPGRMKVGVRTDREFMTPAEFKTIYNRSSSVLHRGTMKHSLRRDRKASPPEIVEFLNKISGIIDMHMVHISNTRYIILCNMQNLDPTAPVHMSVHDTGDFQNDELPF